MICTEQTIGYRPVQSTKKEKFKIKKDKKTRLHPVLAQDNNDNIVSEIDLHSVVKHLKITLDWITIQYSNGSVLIGRNPLWKCILLAHSHSIIVCMSGFFDKR